ncbi:tetratricopeptide repeat protein [Teredinibacter turnerae]|uniref:tetratricopeptide repeat protein n=1 Tax=Teredinibacter turnerae TaxID=2426 RepID=UPI0003670944|nr:tetratricopeptide repeat protein [Teredinibacter turnerae]
MRKHYSNTLLFLPIISLIGLSGCSSSTKHATVGDIDISGSRDSQAPVFVKPKSDAEIKEAYYDYVRNAAKADRSRQAAINRIAALELELTNKLLENSSTSDEALADKVYLQSLEKAADLLSTSLHDFPDAPNNDNTLYQYARTLDQLGRGGEAVEALTTLVDKHPDSEFYAEAQFRIAENAFASGDYLSAEDAYTEVLLTPTSDRFYEKSLFKRGWTRYKQELYREAVDDYLQALTFHGFSPESQLDTSEKELFDEYFRAIGLVFAHLNGAESLTDYFSDRPNFPYLYRTYKVVSDIYVGQQRFSDAAATLDQFISAHPDSASIPEAYLEIVSTWRRGNFIDQLHAEVEEIYLKLAPNADYWQEHNNGEALAKTSSALRAYVTELAYFHHGEYQKKPTRKNFEKSQLWYQRYLESYAKFAQQDKIHARYGDLLSAAGNTEAALKQYAIAAFDGDLVLDKKSAYATIAITNELYRNTQGSAKAAWMQDHLDYVQRYVTLYPSDTESLNLVSNATVLCFAEKQYEKAIEVSSLISLPSSAKQSFDILNTRARSYLNTNQFSDAEAAFTDTLALEGITSSQRKKLESSIALSIYRQAENARDTGDAVLAQSLFNRVSETAPGSELAPTALYDAGSLAFKDKSWQAAIFYLEKLQNNYPNQKYAKQTSRQLSVAYLNSKQTDKAASQFEALAKSDDTDEVKMTALWQAAKLYDEKNNTAGAIRSYRDYAHNYREPYPQNIEAMYRLTQLYEAQNEPQKRYFWQNKIRARDKRISAAKKTDRTIFIASTTVLDLALQKQREFQQIRLKEPLAVNLKRKKAAMQEAIKLFGQASAYDVTDITTRATYNIGEIYREFSQSLLTSERPKNLDATELEQYIILLEDQAFPFEEKSIEFYETNLSRVKNGIYNQWIEESHKKLISLFPVRFNKSPKLESSFDD